MSTILSTFLGSALAASLGAALCLIAMPALARRYRAKSLYILCVAVLVALWIPFQLIPSALKVPVPTPVWLEQPVAGGAASNQGTVNDPLTQASLGSSALPGSGGVQPSGQRPQGNQGNEASEGMAQWQLVTMESDSLPQEEAASEAVNPSGQGNLGQNPVQGGGSFSYTQAVSPSAQAAGQAHPFTWGQALALVWLAVAAGLLLLQGVQHLLFLRTVKRWRKPLTRDPYPALLLDAREAQKVRRPVKLFVCPPVSSPMLVGVLHPAILLPDENLSPEELAYVLRHELTHYRRGDLWVKGLMLLSTSLLWWNPITWLLARATAFYQEASCDEAVTRQATMEDKRFYSETIIRVIRRQAYPRTALSTSFYGGKNGMKRRILSIMSEGGKRAGGVLCALALLVVAATGMALSPTGTAPEPTAAPAPLEAVAGPVQDPWVGQTAYIANASAGGSRLLTVPSVNDWDIPMGAYVNGTPVTVLETRESSFLLDWPHQEGQDNWAQIAIGGDGLEVGHMGFMPLHHLALEAPEAPALTAQVQPESDTGHANLYARNEDASPLVTILAQGETLTLLGDLDDWLHVRTSEGALGFLHKADAQLSPEADTALATFLPHRFDFLSRQDYNHMVIIDRLVAAKTKENGGKYMDDWPQEDKAWYSQLMETYDQGESMRYVLPETGDLPEADALTAAWLAFSETFNLSPDSRDQYLMDAYLYVTESSGERLWDVRIGPEGGSKLYVTVTPRGEATIPEGDVIWWWEESIAYSEDLVRDGVAKVPQGITSITNEMFAGRRDMTQVILPDSLKRIEAGTFLNCTGLLSLAIPSSVDMIAEEAFEGCTALKEITLPNNIHYLGSRVLAGCKSLEAITIPDSVEYIEEEAFMDCAGLREVIIPTRVVFVDDQAFAGCTALERVDLPTSLVEMGEDVFWACPEDVSFLTEEGSFAREWVEAQ